MWNRVGNNAWQTCCLTFLRFIPYISIKQSYPFYDWCLTWPRITSILAPVANLLKHIFLTWKAIILIVLFFIFYFLYKNQGYNSEKTVVGKSINQKQLHQLCLLLCITQCQGHVIFSVYVLPPGEESPTFLYQTIMWMWHAEHVHRQHVSLISRIFVKADWRVRFCVCMSVTIFSHLEDNLVTDAPVMTCPISFVLISLISSITNQIPNVQSCHNWFLPHLPQKTLTPWILMQCHLWLHNDITQFWLLH